VTEDAISIGGVDLADPDTYVSGMPFAAFRKLRECAPVAWHPYKDGPGFLALTGCDEVFAVSRDSATWSSEATGVVSRGNRDGRGHPGSREPRRSDRTRGAARRRPGIRRRQTG
jgi:hypothetical protein